MTCRSDRPRPFRPAFVKHATWFLIGTLVFISCVKAPGSLRSKLVVRGRVLVASGQPMPGTSLSFQPGELGLNDYAHATADSSGAYSVRLTSGTYRVSVNPGLGFLAHTEWVTVSNHHDWINFSFGGHRVTGRVITTNGTLVDSGRVMAILQSPSNGSSAEALSFIERGSYSLLLPSGSYSLRATTSNYWSGLYPAFREPVSIVADTVIDFEVGGVSVSGRVVGPDNLPLKDAVVEVVGHPARVHTDDDGRYQLYVPSGSYKLVFQCSYPFFMPPRTIGPLAITSPALVDVSFSGVVWKGRIRRIGTSEPPQGIIVAVLPTENADGRAAAIGTGPRGDFRFVVEPGRRYDLEVYDRETREKEKVLEGATAAADTSFEILLPPLVVATRADSTVALSIRPASEPILYIQGKKSRRPVSVEATLRNNDPDSVTLVLPGDGSYFGRRTPLMDWEVLTADGRRVERQGVLLCGNINPLRADEVFTLPPGGEKKFLALVPSYYQYKRSGHYRLKLTYENRPRLSWAGDPLGRHDATAMRRIQKSTRCKLVSNAIQIEVK